MKPSLRINKHWDTGKIVVVYALFGCLWIYFSDTVLAWLVSDHAIMTQIAIFKGLLFIALTSTLLFFLITRLRDKIEQSTKALRESEELLRFLIKNSSDSLVIINVDGSLKYISPAAERISGFPIAELEGRAFETLIHSDDIKEIQAAWNEAVKHPEKTVTVQYRHIHKTQGWAYSEAIAQSFLNDPAINGVIASVRDITERKIAEEAIEKHKQVLQLFIEYAPASIAMFDTEMRYISASQRFLTDYRIGDHAIIGKSHYDVFPEIPERLKEIHRRCLQGAIERCDQDPFPRSNGKLEWIRWEMRPWYENTGKIGGLILFSEVITKQVEDAENVRESEKKFRDLFHQHSAVKLIIDPDTGNIVDANIAAEKFYGWSTEQLKKMRIQDINTLSPEKIQVEIEKVRNRERGYFEFRHRLADGSARDVSIYSSKISIKGKELIHSIVHDISERKKAEEEKEKLREQLVQAQKMESVGLLAGGVAHDFNNMLGVILGHAEMAMGQLDPAQPLFADLDEIRKAASRSADLTRQLLAFARKQTVAPKVLDLNETIEGLLKMLRRLIGEDIDLVWMPGTGLWPVKLDPSQLDQILANLCVNARDSIAGVGKIIVKTGNDTFDEEFCTTHAGCVSGEYVKISVSDTGRGMDRKTLSHIFEPFFTTKGVGEGTGLGLSTVYGAVKQNNGFIDVYSEPEQGTIFTINLPRFKDVSTTGQEYKEGAAAPIVGGHETILLVEDEPTILKMTAMMLQRLGYTVLTANTPYAAIRIAGESVVEIHLLMTDVIMPEMNGRDLADRLLTIKTGMKCLFMSGYTSDIIASQGVLVEGMCFIQKPFTQKDLAIRIREALGIEEAKLH
jgi:two-component system, cell cycle sensor histidine kinase and response regulator CckA